MIGTVIFSFNRAMQLETLLQSIITYDPKGLLKVSVLYAASFDAFEKGYSDLKAIYPQVAWVREDTTRRFVWPFLNTYWHNYYWWGKFGKNRSASGFKKQLLQILANSRENAFMFLTDDSLFYREIELPDHILKKIDASPAATSFSFRHGRHLAGGNFKTEDGLLQWSVYRNQPAAEWRYPFSVDGHVYARQFLLKSLRKVHFNNPNSLEGHLACYANEKGLLETVYAHPESSLVGFELNRVQQVCENNSLAIHPSYLNTLFSEGFRLRIEFDKKRNSLFRPERFSAVARRGNITIEIVAPN